MRELFGHLALQTAASGKFAKKGEHGSNLLWAGIQGGGHRADQFLPALRVFPQALPAGRGEAVELGAAVVVAHAPFGGEQALKLQAVERGVERALFDFERTAGDLADAEEYAVAVQGAERHGLQDEDVEGAGKE